MEGRRPSGAAWRAQQGPVAGLPIGFRFRPTDEELLLHYLRRKALDCPLPAGVIPDADLARLHPSDLLPHHNPSAAGTGGDADGERFFFHRTATRCWRKGGGAARAAGDGGVWRPSGKERLVASPRCGGRPVGTKRTLVFFHGRGRRAKRTGWAMHEYRLLPAGLHPFHGCAAAGGSPPNAPHVSNHGAATADSDWVVCRIFRRTKPAAAHRDQEDDDETEEMPSTPSSASSCVTDTSETGEQEQDDEEESSSSSNGGRSSCSVASN
ncbi:hypothetical protein HU200_064682 [Digitaria exilis]|uniref:NAC domain-containing protein n=1 Tax=Digitaria exilis TaxID=1010633 RepID=A0A835A1C9_9POAL|nr:hypothetical protein HU200_064682 [Digitaria exilis]CAB3479306.1 unnamed protein product [Digitaria exilis]